MKCVLLSVIIFSLILIFPISVFSYQYSITFFGINVNKELFIGGENVIVNTTIINQEYYVHTNLTIYFKLVRESDGGIISSNAVIINLDKREVKKLAQNLSIPRSALSGKYTVLVEAYSSSDVSISSISTQIEIKNKINKGAIFDRKGVYLKVPITEKLTEKIVRTIYHYIYGTSGENVPKNSPFYIMFNLTNVGEESLKMDVKIKIVPTYQPDKIIKFIEKNLSTLKIGESKVYEIETKLEKPGTYRVIVELYSDNEKLMEKELRVVIKGEGGSIIGLRNIKDVYKKGEKVKIEITIVGPADKTKVENAYLKLELIKEGQSIKVVNKNIGELSATPATLSFEFEAPMDLMKYEIFVELGKGDEIYDTARASYELLEPQLILSEDGRIRSAKLEGCFDDNICTEKEFEIGNCLDCAGVEAPVTPTITPIEKEEEKPQVMPYILLMGLIIVIVSIILIKKMWLK